MMIGVVFVLAVMLALVFSGVLSLNKNKLVITTGNAEAMYSGKALTNHTWNMEKGSLKKGHEMLVTFKGSQTSVGESENVMEVKIIDELGADVTGDYSIDFKFGKIKVNPRVLVITSESASKQYDGKPLTATEYEISPECDGVVKGQKENVIVTGYIVDPGKTNNTVLSVSVRDITGNDVTNNYHIVIREGLLVIDSDEAPSGGGSSGGGGGSSGGGGGSSGGDIQGGTIPDFSGGSNLIPPENLEGTVLLPVFSDHRKNSLCRA